MLGLPENPGVLPCSIRDVFNLIAKCNESTVSITNSESSASSSQNKLTLEYNVHVSYMEIYNETVNDLLNP